MASGGDSRRAVSPHPHPELSACPFCGSVDIGFYEHVYARQFAVMCNACGAEGPRRSVQNEAGQLWNRRA
jgi:Lar family restriction alleviation protein